MRREIEKRLQIAKQEVIVLQEKSQNSEFTPKTNDLLDFTESVEEYVEDILPPKRADSDARNLNQIHEPEPEIPRVSVERTSSTDISVASTSKKANSEPFKRSAHATTKQEKLPQQRDIETAPTPTSASTVSSTSNTATDYPSDSRTEYYIITYQEGRAKEYINDPNGTILSPPKAKSCIPPTDARQKPRREKNWEAKRQDAKAKSTCGKLAEPFSVSQGTPESEAVHDTVSFEMGFTEKESGSISDFIS